MDIKIMVVQEIMERRKYIGKQGAKFGVDILSNINAIARRDLLILDIFLFVERGKEGQWVVVSFNIKDVGSNQNNNGMRPNMKFLKVQNGNDRN